MPNRVEAMTVPMMLLVSFCCLLPACCGQNSTDIPSSAETTSAAPTQLNTASPRTTTAVLPSPLVSTAASTAASTADVTPAPSCTQTNGVLVCKPDLPTTLPPVDPLRPSVPTGWIVGFAIACVLVVVLAATLHFATLKIRRIRREMARALRMMQSPMVPPRREQSVALLDGGERGGCLEDPHADEELATIAQTDTICKAPHADEEYDVEHYHDAERLLARSVSPADLEPPAPSKADRLAHFHALHSVDPELENLMPVSQVERIPRDIFTGPNPHTEYD